MKSTRQQIMLIVILFVCSRIIAKLAGLELDYTALARYWQYLDIDVLRSDLLAGVWFDHTQPPVFNMLLGIILKISGGSAELVFSIVFKMLSLCNTLLLFAILRRTIRQQYLPLILSLIYLLSPATIIFENELFYTSFISMLLLISCFFAFRLAIQQDLKTVAGFIIPLLLVCLSRSMYHLLYLLVIIVIAIIFFRKKGSARNISIAGFCAVIIVGSWYVKNLVVFDSFSSSTWMGMNIARNIFHDVAVTDSNKIASIEPFSPLPDYERFRDREHELQYRGLNDAVLMNENKNDSLVNHKQVGYITISKKYQQEGKDFIKAHPGQYLKNVAQSAIIFFAPATRYPSTEFQAKKIKYYDLVYSLNLSQLAEGKQQRRIALAVSALPRVILYLAVFSVLAFSAIRSREISFLQLFVMLTIAYVFTVSSLFEHFENMRFRYEIEPMFMILLAFAIDRFLKRRK